jgi:glyoxylase-like metal-dependent hydrolase (beta-lactamase superfamily II)
MKKYETGYYGNTPGRWEESAKTREDCRNSKLKPPTLLYKDLMIFDDGKHRVELHYFGVSHTHGDGFAWLPKEGILFTGDACVNGPYNYMGDGDSGQWVRTLTNAQKLRPKQIGPGHGPIGDGNLLEEQKMFFMDLRKEVGKIKDKSPEDAQRMVDDIRKRMMVKHAKYIDPGPNAIIQFESQAGQVYKEMTGKEFPKKTAMRAAYLAHADFHGTAGK